MYLDIINDSLSKMITNINSNNQPSVLSKKQTINEGRLTDKYSNFQTNNNPYVPDSYAPLLKRKNQSNEYKENENNKTILYIDNSYSMQQKKQLQDQVINKARSIFDDIDIKYFAEFVSTDPRKIGEGNNSNCVIQDIQEEQPTNVLIFTDEDFSAPVQSNCIVPGVVIFIFESKDYLSFNPKKYVRGENGNKVIYLDSYVEESYNISEAKNKSDQICSICGKPYKGYGNNAYPVNDGRCCDDCNYSAVISARIKAIQKNRANSDVSESYDDEDDSWVPKDDYEAQSTLYGDKPVYDYDVYDELLNEELPYAGKVIITHKKGDPKDKWNMLANGFITDEGKSFLYANGCDDVKEVNLTQDQIYNFEDWVKNNYNNFYTEALNESNLNEWTANYWTAYSKDGKSQKGFDDVYKFLSFIDKYSDQISKVSSNECQPIDLQKFLSYNDMQRGELFNITPQQFGHYWPDKSITDYGKAQLKNNY